MNLLKVNLPKMSLPKINMLKLNFIKNENSVISWLTVLLLLVLVVLSANVGFRLLAIQKYLPEFAEHFEGHVGDLQKIAQSAQSQSAAESAIPFLGEVSLESDPIQGDLETAEIVIIEFIDFECPYCAQATSLTKEILDQYPGKISIVHKDYPLPFHPNALLAAQAANCAGDQGKYWEMHDLLYEDQEHLDLASLEERAVTLGLDQTKLDECLSTGMHEDEINQDLEDGKSLKIQGTPAFIVGKKYPLSGSETLLVNGYIVFQSELSQTVEELLEDREE